MIQYKATIIKAKYYWQKHRPPNHFQVPKYINFLIYV